MLGIIFFVMINTKFRGDAVVALVMSELLELGHRVLEPRSDVAPYDLVVDVSGKFHRLQVRRAFRNKRGGGPRISTEKIYPRRNGTVRRRYDASQIDFLVAVWQRKTYVFPIRFIEKFSSSVSLVNREEYEGNWNQLTCRP